MAIDWHTEETESDNISVNDGVLRYYADINLEVNDIEYIAESFAKTYDHNGNDSDVTAEIRILTLGHSVKFTFDSDGGFYFDQDDNELVIEIGVNSANFLASESDGVDLETSMSNYEDACQNALRAAFPYAEITFDAGIGQNERHYISNDKFADSVNNIIKVVYDGQDWLAKATVNYSIWVQASNSEMGEIDYFDGSSEGWSSPGEQKISGNDEDEAIEDFHRIVEDLRKLSEEWANATYGLVRQYGSKRGEIIFTDEPDRCRGRSVKDRTGLARSR